MASVPQNPDGPPIQTLRLPLKPPRARSGKNTLLGAPPQAPDTARHCATPRVLVIFAPQIRQFFHQRVTLTTTGKCGMEMRTPPGNGLHPRRSLYFFACRSSGKRHISFFFNHNFFFFKERTLIPLARASNTPQKLLPRRLFFFSHSFRAVS